MDEIEALPLHRWLCACRQLMAREPDWGADQFAVYLRLGSPRLHLGWNRLLDKASPHTPPSYVYIAEDEGLTSPALPPDVDPASVPTAPDPTPAAETALWRQTRDLAGQVASLKLTDYPPARVEKIMASIDETVHATLDDAIAATKELGRTCLRRLVEAREGSRNRQLLIGDFLQPTRDVLAAYMSFEVDGRSACEALAFVLSIQCNLPQLGPLETTPPDARARAIEHLIDQADELLIARERANVTPYFELTYAANLLVATAVQLNSHQRELVPEYEGRSHLNRRVHYGEELIGHGTAAAFALPAAVEPLEMARLVRDRAKDRGESALDYARTVVVHPAFQGALLEAADSDALDAASALERYQRAASTAESVDALALINQKAGPVAEENAKEMHMHLLAFSMG
ncbi:MAG TPA: hypothetical protein VLK89_01145 [Solirubrobacterales bacterium]|nr:hypothetical protein [Solirubrobacterales bacterium]